MRDSSLRPSIFSKVTKLTEAWMQVNFCEDWGRNGSLLLELMWDRTRQNTETKGHEGWVRHDDTHFHGNWAMDSRPSQGLALGRGSTLIRSPRASTDIWVSHNWTCATRVVPLMRVTVSSQQEYSDLHPYTPCNPHPFSHSRRTGITAALFDCWSRGFYMAATNEQPLLRGRPEKGTHEYYAAK